MVVADITLEALLAGIAGGVFGAVLGGLPALSIAGVVVLAGEVGNVVASRVAQQTLADPAAIGTVGITETVGLGPVFGPHVAFAGGVAAAAYAGRHGGVDTSFPYHQAKDVTRPLGSGLDVLLAGGIFGLIGVLLARLAAGAALPVDAVALSIVLSGFLHRLAFGYPLLGRLGDGVLDMGPYERDERRTAPGEEAAGLDEGRWVVEPWQPYHYAWPNVVGLGLAVGIAAGYVGLVTQRVYLAFAIALASLLFLSLGLDRLPVTHHMALPASIVALGLPGLDPPVALLVAGVFGVLGALLGEVAQRTLYAHADTHLDPSFVSILVTSLVLAGLASGGVLDPAAVPYPLP